MLFSIKPITHKKRLSWKETMCVFAWVPTASSYLAPVQHVEARLAQVAPLRLRARYAGEQHSNL